MTKNDAPHPVDVRVGARLSLRRKERGLTQSQLGGALGITFQQVQKYENGANRISASKLFDAAAFLDTPVSYFFDQAEAVTDDLLITPGVDRLLAHWRDMSPAARKTLQSLAAELASRRTSAVT